MLLKHDQGLTSSPSNQKTRQPASSNSIALLSEANSSYSFCRVVASDRESLGFERNASGIAKKLVSKPKASRPIPIIGCVSGRIRRYVYPAPMQKSPTNAETVAIL